MENPMIKTKVVHSKSKPAWNVVGETLGKKNKIARLTYLENSEFEKKEAFQHAEFISYCFNKSDVICEDKLLNEFLSNSNSSPDPKPLIEYKKILKPCYRNKEGEIVNGIKSTIGGSIIYLAPSDDLE